MSKLTTVETNFLGQEEGDAPSPFLSLGAHNDAPMNPHDISSLGAATEPMTIFYNRKVNVFYLPQDKAEDIIRWLERNSAQVNAPVSNDRSQLMPSSVLDNLKKDMPLTRKKSLETFLRRRKERLRIVPRPTSPRESSVGNGNSCRE